MPARFAAHPYTDGSTRITLTVPHTLTARAIATLLCSAHRTTDAGNLPDLTYTSAIRTLRAELKQRGNEDPYFWGDDFDEEDQDAAGALRDWSLAETTRLFPELGSPT
ncbi:hypothetical protein [Streptomyces sp. NPDC001889]